MSWDVSPWVYPVWDSLGFLDLGDYFLPHFREVSTIISSNIFSWPFFLSSSSGTPMIQMLGCFTLSQRSLRLSSFILIHFSFFYSHLFLSFYLLPHLSYLLPPLFYYLFPPECFFFYLIYCIIHYWLTLSCFFYVLAKHFLHLLSPCLQAVYL